MTDTVNVPREALIDQINALVAIPDANLSRPIPFLARDLLAKASAALAAAPKAEPVSDPYKLEGPPREPTQSMMDALLYHSSPDTTHSDAYTMWTSAHDAWMRDDAQPLSNPQQLPEAPKVEQVPVAWLRDAHGGQHDECLVPAAQGDPDAFPVYRGPASDELLNELHLLEEVCARYADDEEAYLRDDGEPFGTISTECGLKARAARKRYLARLSKHKGPQS